MIARHEAQQIDRNDVWARLAAPVAPETIAWRQDGRPIQRDGRFIAPPEQQCAVPSASPAPSESAAPSGSATRTSCAPRGIASRCGPFIIIGFVRLTRCTVIDAR